MHDLDAPFKALADPTRRAILRMLQRGPLNAGRLAEELGVAPNALSFHLRVLKGAGLIRDQRHGQFIRYALNASVAEDLVRTVMEHLGAARRDKKTRPPEAGEAPAVASRRADDVDEVGQTTTEEADDVTLL